MKNLTFILVMVSVFLFSSCDKSEPETFWYSYGTYIETETDNFIIDLDDGSVLIPTQVAYIEEGVVDSSRVMVVYVIVSETDSTINAKVDNITGLLTKGVLQLTEDNQDSIGNDGVIVTEDDIWFSENHLNVRFRYFYYYQNIQHYINLVKPIGNPIDEKGNQILEFRHNDNGDYSNYSSTGIVSFDMWSLYEEGVDSLNFLFTAYDYDSTKFSWEGTYHYDIQSVVSSPNFTHYKKQTSVEMPQSEFRFR
jgi:hypothetical protein